MWLSDSILARIDSNRLLTHSRTCYELIGSIDSSQNDQHISMNFKDGFPLNWKEVIKNESE